MVGAMEADRNGHPATDDYKLIESDGDDRFLSPSREDSVDEATSNGKSGLAHDFKAKTEKCAQV